MVAFGTIMDVLIQEFLKKILISVKGIFKGTTCWEEEDLNIRASHRGAAAPPAPPAKRNLMIQARV